MIKEKKRSTIIDVARHAGVSIATVSHVLNQTHYVSKELRLRVKKAIRELNYRPNYIGRCLRKGKSGTVALIVPDIADPFFPEVTRGVEDFLGEHAYNLFLCNTDENPSKELLYLEIIESRQVDGIIIAPTISQKDTISTLEKIRKPVVIIDRGLSGVNFDQVFSDNVGGAYKAINHLLHLGHRRIGIIVPRSKIITIVDRLKGYKIALEEYGVKMDEDLISEGCFGIKGGYEATKTLLKKNSDISAILSTNDSMTLGAMLLLKEKSIKCPEDLSIVSFDDPPWTRAFTPTLTVVAQQTYQMGCEAARLLWSKLSSKSEKKEVRKIKLDTSLRIRESTGFKS